MRETKQFPTTSFAASGDYDQEYSGSFIDRLGFKLDGSATDAATGTAVEDRGARLLGNQIRVEQNEDVLIALNPITLKHVSAATNGGYEKAEETNPNASTEKVLFNANLDLKKMLPGAGIDARLAKVFQRGTFGALADYTSGVDSITATNRPWVEVNAEAAPDEYWRPAFSERSVDISSATTEQQEVFRFERAQAVPAFFLRQYDNSANARADGIVRRLKVSVTRAGRGDRDVMSTTWGILRQHTSELAGFTSGDWDNAVGTCLVQMRDPRLPQVGGATIFEAGDVVTFTIDTSTTVEGEFDSVTPASGDKLFISKLAFDRARGLEVMRALNAPSGFNRNGRRQRGTRAGLARRG